MYMYIITEHFTYTHSVETHYKVRKTFLGICIERYSNKFESISACETFIKGKGGTRYRFDGLV